MNLEMTTLSEISQRRRNIIQYHLYVESKKQKCKWTCLQSKNRNTDVENKHLIQFSSVHSLGHVWLFVTPWTTALQTSLSITNSRSPPKPMSIESVMPSNHLILCCPFSSCPQSLPSSGYFQMSQLFTSGSQSIGELQLQQQSSQITPRTDLL